MSTTPATSAIRLRGVRQNNLKHFDLDIPLHRLIVVTGLSGSGKSSLAFDTLYAEGQRRYIETFSPYARQFFDRMDKPQVDSVEGIPPAIAIEQRNSVRTTRSTVGTLTEICDYMKALWPCVAQLHCRQCGRHVHKDSPQDVWRKSFGAEEGADNSSALPEGAECLVTFDVPLSEKLSLAESLDLISKQGYQRLLLNGEIVRLEDAVPRLEPHPSRLTVVQDRLRLSAQNRSRFVEASEQSYHFGKGKLAVHEFDPPNARAESPAGRETGRSARHFSNRLHCAHCDIEYREPSTALFSFNHPLGACPACKGFGRIITIDYNLAIPDRSLTLAGGAVKPWRGGFSAESQDDLRKFCKLRGIPMGVPFNKLPAKLQKWVIEGDEGYGSDESHRWPRAWYGIKGYFKWLETKSYKMHVRVLLSRYRAYTTCPACHGSRFQPDALLYRLDSPAPSAQSDNPSTGLSSEGRGALTLADFYGLTTQKALRLIERLASHRRFQTSDPITLVLGEVRSRLGYLNEVGLGYLTLDRPTRTLSGGETERVNLTACLGTRLVNTLFVLDEPSVGLHPRDTDRLVRVLCELRDAGNTIVVVEHEARVIRAADQIIDLGPGHGASGGQVVFQGDFAQLQASSDSLTGGYLAGHQRMSNPERRPVLLGDETEGTEGTQGRGERGEGHRR